MSQRGLKLDAVVEIKVDERILINRIETRIGQMQARSEPVRADDKPEVLKQRLTAYRAQTAPLIDYYGKKSLLKSVDGMQPIDQVSVAIGRVLTGAPARARKAEGRKAPKKAARKTAKRVTKASGSRRKARVRKAARPARKTARKAKARKTKPKQARRAARRG